ncbi:uncharacterized protein LOC100607096 isoform X1 [Nomascus leucogenys]|uniref:uncharacterized protein LOC100607096 isoform X1 n=1 Tax=Nomascus leucogenys TaxID=61853 RepID=UPI00122D5D12|nr:uncharacterized protein LOC100607096 isoform X1 [Nomascus leucogenys]
MRAEDKSSIFLVLRGWQWGLPPAPHGSWQPCPLCPGGQGPAGPTGPRDGGSQRLGGPWAHGWGWHRAACWPAGPALLPHPGDRPGPGTSFSLPGFGEGTSILRHLGTWPRPRAPPETSGAHRGLGKTLRDLTAQVFHPQSPPQVTPEAQGTVSTLRPCPWLRIGGPHQRPGLSPQVCEYHLPVTRWPCEHPAASHSSAALGLGLPVCAVGLVAITGFCTAQAGRECHVAARPAQEQHRCWTFGFSIRSGEETWRPLLGGGRKASVWHPGAAHLLDLGVLPARLYSASSECLLEAVGPVPFVQRRPEKGTQEGNGQTVTRQMSRTGLGACLGSSWC